MMRLVVATVAMLAMTPAFSHREESIEVRLLADKTSFLTGEPCQILLEIRNLSPGEAILPSPRVPRIGGGLRVWRAANDEIPMKPGVSCPTAGGWDPFLKLPAGCSHHQIFDLSDYYTLPLQGQIKLSFEFRVPDKPLRILGDEAIASIPFAMAAPASAKTRIVSVTHPGSFFSNELTIQVVPPSKAEDEDALAAWRAMSTADRFDQSTTTRKAIAQAYPSSMYAQYGEFVQYREKLNRWWDKRERELNKRERDKLAPLPVVGDDQDVSLTAVRTWCSARTTSVLADDLWFHYLVTYYAREHSAEELRRGLEELIRTFPESTGSTRATAYLRWSRGYSFFSP